MRELKRFADGRVDWQDTGYANLTQDQIREYMVRLTSILECIVSDEQLERAVYRALDGTLSPRLDNARPPTSTAPTTQSGTDAARAVLAPPTPVHTPPGPSGEWVRTPAKSLSSPLAPQDYFAVDRKGKVPLNPPDGAELQTLSIVSAAEKPSAKGKFLQVIFSGRGGKANCFDVALWPHIKKAQGHEAQLWIKESGNYLNIVGVRA